MPERRRAMGAVLLSHQLIDGGFFCALGTTEHPGMTQPGVIVKKGTPFTWDYNNGTFVVYDEAGRPWITGDRAVMDRFEVACHQLSRGAYVPHSNDSGHFIRAILPTLL